MKGMLIEFSDVIFRIILVVLVMGILALIVFNILTNAGPEYHWWK